MIKESAEGSLTSLGLPFNMGCVLGGGSWKIVEAIIADVFSDSKLPLYICQYDDRQIK